MKPEILVDIPSQLLTVLAENQPIATFPVSTAKLGTGEYYGSYRTPRGKHLIRAKIGAGKPMGAVFVDRRPTGEIFSPDLAKRYPGRDWILTRILWLSGCEVGFNRLGKVDTMRRCIYIHGISVEENIRRPSSHGCIGMRNPDILELFDRVAVGTPVLIRG